MKTTHRSARLSFRLFTTCVVLLVSLFPVPAQADSPGPPILAITGPVDQAEMSSLSTVAGTVTWDQPLTSLTFMLREIDHNGGPGRWWNGTVWQDTEFNLATTRSETNWAKSPGVVLPPLNSGLSFEITAIAADDALNTNTTTIIIHASIQTLTWDPGTAHAGTEVLPQPNTNGGSFLFRIVAQNSDGWRSALNVTRGEADLYLGQGFTPSSNSYHFASTRAGSDGWVLHSSEFAESQEWYYLVQATPGSRWNLVSGAPYVLDLATLPGPGASGDTNVVMGAEGLRFFSVLAPNDTLAWRLWLHGATNDIFIKKGFIPLPPWWQHELHQAAAMLVVPDYLQVETTYIVGVPGEPGTNIFFHSKQQPITDMVFNGAQSGISVNGYPYTTHRVPVPIDQVAWEIRTTPANGDPNFAVRREKVPNEWNNDGFSELPGPVTRSVTFVPPTLSDGIFYVTTYGSTNRAFALFNGEPVITDRPYIGVTINDRPGIAGWRYYRVTDVPSQVGTLGWDLILSDQPPNTELALRRNAVPGRWDYRTGDGDQESAAAGQVIHMDYTDPDGWLQRPGHQADIWYIGAYQPRTSLRAFRLTTSALTPAPLAFNNGTSSVTDLRTMKWQYYRIDVPADGLGLDLRVSAPAGGRPQIGLRRDLLPEDLNPYAWPYPEWQSGQQATATHDYTGCQVDADGTDRAGEVLVVSRDNPLQPGTYYAGVRDEGGPGPVSFTFTSRGIGTNYAIGVSNLSFSGAGSTVTDTVGLAPREAAYYRTVIPPNQRSWRVRLTPLSGEVLLGVIPTTLPNIRMGDYYNNYHGGGMKLQKLGREHFLLLPEDGEEFLRTETNYLVVASEGVDPGSGRLGSAVATYQLESLGALEPVPVGSGTLPTPGGTLTQSVSLEGGEIQLYTFTVAPNTPAVEARLLYRTGNPSMTVRFGTNAACPHVPCDSPHNYGAYGGQSSGRYESYELITIANPLPGLYTMTVKAEGLGSEFPPATCALEVKAVAPTPLTFDGGTSSVSSQQAGTWQFFVVNVPSNALGWDVRITDITEGDPRLLVRRDLLPEQGAPGVWFAETNWASGSQYNAEGDWTGRSWNADETVSWGRLMAVGQNNPLTPGTYYVGVYAENGIPATYSILSRGIGAGLTLNVSNLNPSGAGSVAVNSTGLSAREADYYRVVIPANTRSWQLRLTPDGGGEALLAVQFEQVPSLQAGRWWYNSIFQRGVKMQKSGKEHYALFPLDGELFIAAGTYYLAVVSEGVAPADHDHVGAGSVTYRLESFANLLTELGNLPSVGAPALSRPVSVEGGEVRVFHFTVTNLVPAIEARLESPTGNPALTLQPGTNIPAPQIPANSEYREWEHYGVDGGYFFGGCTKGYSLVTFANPPLGDFVLTVRGEDLDDGYPDVAGELSVRAVAPTPLAFDGGSAAITGHLPGAWEYFTVIVPPDAEGWDLRIENPTSGQPRLVVRRDLVPDSTEHPAASEDNWPSGAQAFSYNDFTGLADASGTNISGRVMIAAMGHSLTNGTYYVGVLNQSTDESATYTLVSRGIGGTNSIPVRPLAFHGGEITASNLVARENAWFRVEVPAGSKSWKVKLDTTLGGEAMMVILKEHLPIPAPPNWNQSTYWRGELLQTEGNEHFILLESEGDIPLAGGAYYIAVASQGIASGTRLAVGDSSFIMQSQGELGIINLGTVPPVGSAIAYPIAMEGMEVRAFQFNLPAAVEWAEVWLTDCLGNPAMAVRPGTNLPNPQVPMIRENPFGSDGGFWRDRLMESYTVLTLTRPAPGIYSVTVKAEYVGSEYPDATNTIRIEQKRVATLAFSNGVVSGGLADNQRMFYRVTVPTNILGWKLDLVASNGTPTVRARKDLLPSDFDPCMPFGGPSVVIVPQFLEPGTWFVEVRGGGATAYTLFSSPALLQRSAWTMPASGAPVTTPGLPPSGPVFADSGIDSNGVLLPDDHGLDLGNGDFHYYAFSMPDGNAGLLHTELYALNGDPDLYIRYAGLPSFSHGIYGAYGPQPVDYRQTGPGSQYGNWTPVNGRFERQLAPGTWYLAVHAAGNSNARYRLKLGTGTMTDLAPHVTLAGQVIAAGDWRYYRVAVPTNAPVEWNVTFSQQQGDVILYVRDTVPPGEPLLDDGYRHWAIDRKNGGPYPEFDPAGTYTLTVPPVRPGHVYYLGFRALNDATFTVGYTFGTQINPATNVVNFYGGGASFTLPAFGLAAFRVPVPADATSWRHSNTHAAEVIMFIEQGTLPDFAAWSWLYTSEGRPDSQLIQYLSGWPWVSNQNYYVLFTNTSASAQPVTFRMDGRNLLTDDSDFDGLPDGWEMFYFHNLAQDGSMDFDGDGINNATELAEGTNPANPSSLRPRLTANVSGSGSVVVEPLLASYTVGQTVTLTAVSAPDNSFTGWTGAIETNRNPLVLTMASNAVVTANFVGGTVRLVFTSQGFTPGGNFTCVITGPPGGSLVIQASDNLVSWGVVHTETPFTGTYAFEDTETAVYTNRFYRASVVP